MTPSAIATLTLSQRERIDECHHITRFQLSTKYANYGPQPFFIICVKTLIKGAVNIQNADQLPVNDKR